VKKQKQTTNNNLGTQAQTLGLRKKTRNKTEIKTGVISTTFLAVHGGCILLGGADPIFVVFYIGWNACFKVVVRESGFLPVGNGANRMKLVYLY
jgi:hypothetical protein